MAYRSTNPFTNKVEKSFDELSDAQLQTKLQAAQDCYDNFWRDQSFAQRKVVLKRAAALMRERQQALAEVATREMGKRIAQSAGEVALSAAIIDYYADHGEALLAPQALQTDKGEAVVESSPVALFLRAPDEDAAVALANNSPFGLGGSVFTQDAERGRRLARRIDTGMVFINSAAVSLPDLPFGGTKNSGYGRELSAAGIHEFVNKKLIRVV